MPKLPFTLRDYVRSFRSLGVIGALFAFWAGVDLLISVIPVLIAIAIARLIGLL